MGIRDEIMRELYSDEDIYRAFRDVPGDNGYPHTRLDQRVVDAVIDAVQPRLWVEVGTMLGGSALVAARRLADRGMQCPVVCIDPFCGDVNMWAWERDLRAKDEWRFLKLADGAPTIRERFMANVCAEGLEDAICPIPVTGTIGMKLLKKLHDDDRLSTRPDVIYLDAAHEEGETLLEVEAAWQLLNDGGVLFGDDWNWWGVQSDVLKFAQYAGADLDGLTGLKEALGESAHFQDGVLVWLDSRQWFLRKGDLTLDAPVAAAYKRVGGAKALGIPVGLPQRSGEGIAQTFTGGTVFFSPATGSHVVKGAILQLYADHGGPVGWIGFPIADEADLPDRTGWVSRFEHADITYRLDGDGTFSYEIRPRETGL